MAKGDVHTTHKDGRWTNKVEGNKQASNTAPTKAKAQAKGREMAKKGGAEHLIHNKDGTISQRNSYGNDPRESKG